MKTSSGEKSIVARQSHPIILTRLLSIVVLLGVLTGCDIATVFGPLVAKHGEQVSYQILITESNNFTNTTVYITADIPSGWTYVDALYHASMTGSYPAPAIVHQSDPGVITSLPPVPSGYERHYFSTGSFPTIASDDRGTGILTFLSTGNPGVFDLTFWAGYTSDAVSGYGDPRTITVEVLPAPTPDSLFVDGFEYGDTTAWDETAGLDSALAAYYPLDGTGDDASGNGNHGTLFGGPTGTTDRHGTPGAAMLFDGIDDSIEIADSDSLDLETAITLAAWIRPATTLESYVIQKADLIRGGMVYNLDIYPGKIRGGTHGDPYDSWVQGYSPIDQDEWQHLLFTSSGSFTYGFVNGVLESFTSVDHTSIDVGEGSVSIGAYVSTRYSGVIDEILVMERALTPHEVQELAR